MRACDDTGGEGGDDTGGGGYPSRVRQPVIQVGGSDQ